MSPRVPARHRGGVRSDGPSDRRGPADRRGAARVLRLGPSGVAALAELRLGTVRTANGAALARRLTDAGLAHPRPVAGLRPSVTVLIPVYGRAGALDACLTRARRPVPGDRRRRRLARPGRDRQGGGRPRRPADPAGDQRRPGARPQHRPGRGAHRSGRVPGQRLRPAAGLDRRAGRRTCRPGRRGRGAPHRRRPRSTGRCAARPRPRPPPGPGRARDPVAYVPTAALLARRSRAPRRRRCHPRGTACSTRRCATARTST